MNKGYVYFIESGDAPGPIKIGFAFDPVQRLKTLACANPHGLSLLAKFPGTQSDERALHRRFRKQNITGEWFAPSDDLWALIRLHWCLDPIEQAERDPATDYKTMLPRESVH